MTATLIPAATEAEWLAARQKGVTASEIAVLMGLSPYSSPFELYYRKTGALPEQDDDMAMAIGRHFEDFVAVRFAGLRPEFRLWGDGRKLFAHAERPWQLATPDRLLVEGGGWQQDGPGLFSNPPPVLTAVLECKTDGGFDGWGDDGSDEIPVHYRAQVLWQMDVLGVATGFVACLFMNRRQLRVYELTLDAQALEDLELMRREAMSFLFRVDYKNPPDVDWRPATTNALKRLHPTLEDRAVVIPRELAGRYRAACVAVKTAEHRKHLAENQIRERLGSARHAVENVAIARFDVARRDVYDLPEKTITRKASTVDRLVFVKPKETKP